MHLAAERARQLRKGALPLSDRKNKEVVLSLREIASGVITQENLKNYEPVFLEQDEPIEIIEDDPGFSDSGNDD